jgi:hypothetical protein
MSREWRRGAEAVVFGLAVAVAFAVINSSAGLVRAAEETGPSLQVRSVAVIPFVYTGKVDEEMTAAFADRLSSPKTGWKVVDGASVARKLAKGTKFRSDADVGPLLRAAKAAGADAVILGTAAAYKFLDAPSVRLRVRMFGAGGGETLHDGITEESAWSASGARRDAATGAAKKLVKALGRD